jgi:hypothetical protein
MSIEVVVAAVVAAVALVVLAALGAGVGVGWRGGLARGCRPFSRQPKSSRRSL